MCDQNAHKLFLNCVQAHLVPKPPCLNRDACANVPVSAPASQSCIMTKLPIKLCISNPTTVLHGQNSPGKQIQTGCDQLTGPHGSLSNPTLLVHKPALLQSCIPEKRGIGPENHIFTFLNNIKVIHIKSEL